MRHAFCFVGMSRRQFEGYLRIRQSARVRKTKTKTAQIGQGKAVQDAAKIDAGLIGGLQPRIHCMDTCPLLHKYCLSAYSTYTLTFDR